MTAPPSDPGLPDPALPDPAAPAPAAAGVAAPFGRRAFARLFDITVVGVVVVPVLTLTLRDADDGVRFPLVVIVLYGLLPALYEARLLVRSGATPGKRLSGLCVVQGARARLLGFPLAFVRSVLAWSVPALAVLLLDGPYVLAVLAVSYGPALVPGVRRDLADLVTGSRVLHTGDISDELADDDAARPPERRADDTPDDPPGPA